MRSIVHGPDIAEISDGDDDEVDLRLISRFIIPQVVHIEPMEDMLAPQDLKLIIAVVTTSQTTVLSLCNRFSRNLWPRPIAFWMWFGFRWQWNIFDRNFYTFKYGSQPLCRHLTQVVAKLWLTRCLGSINNSFWRLNCIPLTRPGYCPNSRRMWLSFRSREKGKVRLYGCWLLNKAIVGKSYATLSPVGAINAPLLILFTNFDEEIGFSDGFHGIGVLDLAFESYDWESKFEDKEHKEPKDKSGGDSSYGRLKMMMIGIVISKWPWFTCSLYRYRVLLSSIASNCSNIPSKFLDYLKVSLMGLGHIFETCLKTRDSTGSPWYTFIAAFGSRPCLSWFRMNPYWSISLDYLRHPFSLNPSPTNSKIPLVIA